MGEWISGGGRLKFILVSCKTDNNGSMRNSDGTFGKGNPGKPKGTKNKATQKIREAIAKILEGKIEEVNDWIDQIEKPEEKVRALTGLIEFAVPKLQRTELEHDISDNKIQAVEITVHHTDSTKKQRDLDSES